MTLGLPNLLLIVAGAFTVSVLPFLLLLSYILRIATVAKRTLAIGPTDPPGLTAVAHGNCCDRFPVAADPARHTETTPNDPSQRSSLPSVVTA